MAKVKNNRDPVDSGIKALVDALGYSGAARFLRHFSKGRGDYLVIQEKIFKGIDVGVPSIQKIRLVSSGTEAATAIVSYFLGFAPASYSTCGKAGDMSKNVTKEADKGLVERRTDGEK